MDINPRMGSMGGQALKGGIEMIFYFSGTGNSEWAARELARLTGDTAVSIPDAAKAGKSIEIPEGRPVGIVFPVYAWLPPQIVSDFVSGIPDNGAYRWALCTCGDEAGEAMKHLARKYNMSAAWSIKMPNNYLPMYDVDTEEMAGAKIRNAKQKLSLIAVEIAEQKEVWEVNPGKFPAFKSSLIGPAFNRFGRSDKPFYAEASCTGCGLCQSVCPSQNIELKDGKPVWLGNCLHCMACIHRCPERAIQYGKSTKRKGRYYFSDELFK